MDKPWKASEGTEVQSKGKMERQIAPEKRTNEEMREISQPEAEEVPVNAGQENMPDRPPVRRSERVRLPSALLMESQQMSGFGRKFKLKGRILGIVVVQLSACGPIRLG